MEGLSDPAREGTAEGEAGEHRPAPGAGADTVLRATAAQGVPLQSSSPAPSTLQVYDDVVEGSDNSQVGGTYERDEDDDVDVDDGDHVRGFSLRTVATPLGRGIGALAAPSAPAGGGGGVDGPTPIQYDPHDHTVADASPEVVGSLPAVQRGGQPQPPPPQHQRRRVWVLPRDVLPLPATDKDTFAAAAAAGRNVEVFGDGSIASTRSSTQSAAAASSGAAPGAASAAHAAVGQTDATRHGGGDVLNACVVRLPHPRHGQPFMCLVTGGASASHSGASADAPCVFELQAQAAPGGFVQSWFVGQRVVPSSDGDLLVATPLDTSFFALHDLLGDAVRAARLARVFMAAEALFHVSTDGAADSAVVADADATPTKRPSVFAAVLESMGADDGDSGGEDSDQDGKWKPSSCYGARSGRLAPRSWAAEGRAAHSWTPSEALLSRGVVGGEVGAPYDCSTRNTRPITCTQWPGWARAAAALPCTLHACYADMCTERVLRRMCEVREVGEGEDRAVFFRPSDTVAVAWLRRKVEAVRASEALRCLLQVPESSAEESAAEVPMSMAFGVVAEYVPTRLHAALAAACGLSDPETCATATTDVSLPSTAASGVARATRDTAASLAAATAAAAVAPKSASVKRLEKAGRPKGTPTLFDMFAKKKAKTE